jgi:hypothetical protein
MRYVDAGYAVALATLFVYALSLVARRRRWERAYEMSEPSEPSGQSEPSEQAAADAAAVSGERS